MNEAEDIFLLISFECIYTIHSPSFFLLQICRDFKRFSSQIIFQIPMVLNKTIFGTFSEPFEDFL